MPIDSPIRAPVVVLAAGSLRNAFVDIVDAFRRQSGTTVDIEHGPAGLLREKIENGAAFDVFASANMAHPERLNALGLAGETRCFARNRLCIIARRSLGITVENLIDTLLDPNVKLGTSTPNADPSGDYALDLFDKIEALHPGAGTALAAKARPLVGGRTTVAIPAGHSAAGWLIQQGLADVFVSYASNGLLSQQDDSLQIVPLPDSICPIGDYGVTLRSGAGDDATLFRDHLFTPETRQTLTRHGFLC